MGFDGQIGLIALVVFAAFAIFSPVGFFTTLKLLVAGGGVLLLGNYTEIFQQTIFSADSILNKVCLYLALLAALCLVMFSSFKLLLSSGALALSLLIALFLYNGVQSEDFKSSPLALSFNQLDGHFAEKKNLRATSDNLFLTVRKRVMQLWLAIETSLSEPV
ncbi:MAG TPA: hypothetical protein PKD37_07055 [Oligoflexia bacterium]|nr:hypothetical protein [Oligoflexia bacterium]HMP27721.1 hypothetical protein [Oligoflexia bacterium]